VRREYQGSEIDMIYVAFRVSHPSGDKIDKEGEHFFGWDETFDEWMPRSSARLAKYQTHTDESLKSQTPEA